MSDLIDRYLMAVSANLPKEERADITAELRDILFSKVEAREAELGHPLDRREEEALLHDFGHPLEVAGRYGTTHQLIGPEVYPFYIFALKVAMGIMAAIYLALCAMFVASGSQKGAHDQDIVTGLLVTFALVTLVFLAIDRAGVIGKIARSWKPSSLPMLGAPVARSPFEVLFEAVWVVLVILWWVGAVHLPQPAPSAIMSLSLGPVFDQLHYPILALLAAQLGLDGFELAMPGLAKVHAITRIGVNVAVIGLILVLMQADHMVLVHLLRGRPGLESEIQAGFDNGFRIGCIGGIVVAIWDGALAARRFIRFERLRKAQIA
jgi:hypothetical protein